MTTNDILAQFPEPATLPASRLRWVLVFVGCAFLLVMGLGLIASNAHWPKWIYGGCSLFGGLGGSIIAISSLIPGAAYLKLDRDGFEEHTLLGKRRVEWREASNFRVGYLRALKFVDFDCRGPIKRWPLGPCLGENYRLPADALATLLNAWRERALSADGMRDHAG